MSYLLLLGGLVLLIGGGELLVRGAVRLAAGIGVSPLVIGLTVVGFGTSTPELVTSVQAALSGTPGIAIGNIVGSNIANVLLILGCSALLYPIAVNSAALRRDGAVLIAVTVAFVVLAAAMPLGRVIGTCSVLLLVWYVAYLIRAERGAPADAHGAVHDKAVALEHVDAALDPALAKPSHAGLSALLCLVGLGLLVFGGSLFVSGAVALAQQLGVSDTVIGLTVVAVGTSLPEFITSVIAAVRKEADVAFGNIVGSNIYNLLGIGGLTALTAPLTVPPQMVAFDNLAMLAAALLMVGFAWTGLRIGRREGAVMLGGYVAYVYLLWPAS